MVSYLGSSALGFGHCGNLDTSETCSVHPPSIQSSDPRQFRSARRSTWKLSLLWVIFNPFQPFAVTHWIFNMTKYGQLGQSILLNSVSCVGFSHCRSAATVLLWGHKHMIAWFIRTSNFMHKCVYEDIKHDKKGCMVTLWSCSRPFVPPSQWYFDSH